MVELARAAPSHRIIVAGDAGVDILRDLHLRGYPRTTVLKPSRIPPGQHDVALVAWHAQSIRELGPVLDRLVHVLSSAGVLVVWLASRDHAASGKLRSLLARLAFRIESGAVCGNGVAIAARRLEAIAAAKAA
jgi:hypothetical protein